jgi:16S rRNA processing protein RimM
MSTASMDENFILLGKVVRAQGIRGEIKIFPYSGRPENFLSYGKIFLSLQTDEKKRPYTIEKSRVQGKMAVLKLEDIETRSTAESLIEQRVWLERDDLPLPEKDEYYLIDLEGKKAITEDGKCIGVISGMLDTAMQDILIIMDRDVEYLVPLCREFLVRYDEEQVVFNLPPGLLEINRK